MVTIADLDHLEVECDVKEDYISRVVSGAPAEVAVDAVPDRRYRGRVRKIIPMGDRARATIKVQVEILDGDERLFPDMSSTVYFLPAAESTETSDEPRYVLPWGCDSIWPQYNLRLATSGRQPGAPQRSLGRRAAR